MKPFFDWLMKSSADPARVSLTVKSSLLALLPVAMIFTGINGEEANTAIEAVSNTVFYGLSTISAVGVVYGFGRKLWLTFKK